MDTDFFESGRREPRKWVSDSDRIVSSFLGFLDQSAFALIHGLSTLVSALLVARLIAPKSSGTSGRISSRRFDRDRISTTAISNLVRSCCFPSFRSPVIKASNSRSANASRSPFLMPAQPRRGTVVTECPARSRTSRRSTHSSSRMELRDQRHRR